MTMWLSRYAVLDSFLKKVDFMSQYPKVESTYHKIEIDNPICQRRFHIAYESGVKPENHVEVKCPHCGVVLFDENNHSPAILAREENLVNSPDGSRPMVYECKFSAK